MLSSNLALVNNFFRLEGWRLLLMSLIFFGAFFIRGLAFSRGRVSLTLSNLGLSIPLSNLGGGGGIRLSSITPDSFEGFQ